MKKILIKLLISVGLSSPISAFAGTEFYTPIPKSGAVVGYIDYDGYDSGYSLVDVSLTTTPTSEYRYNGSGGQFKGYFSTTSSDVTDTMNKDNLFFRFFCIDLYQPTPNLSAVNGSSYVARNYVNSNIQKLYDLIYPNYQSLDFYNDVNKTNFGKFTSYSELSAAFQLAVWELKYETNTTHNLDDGIFKDTLTSNAHSIANQLLEMVDNYSGTRYQNWHLYSFTSTSRQDFLSATYSIPEPNSLLLLGVAVFGLIGVGRIKLLTSQ